MRRVCALYLTNLFYKNTVQKRLKPSERSRRLPSRLTYSREEAQPEVSFITVFAELPAGRLPFAVCTFFRTNRQTANGLRAKPKTDCHKRQTGNFCMVFCMVFFSAWYFCILRSDLHRLYTRKSLWRQRVAGGWLCCHSSNKDVKFLFVRNIKYQQYGYRIFK